MAYFDLDKFKKEFDFNLFINEFMIYERNSKQPFMTHFQNNIITQTGYKLAQNYAMLLFIVNEDTNFLSKDNIKQAQQLGLKIFSIEDFIQIVDKFEHLPIANRKDKEAFNNYKAVKNNVCLQIKILNHLLKINPDFLTENQRMRLKELGLDLTNTTIEFKK